MSSPTIARAVIPTFQYLFRFRDLVARTLVEHESVITARGACWWGWWKRPSESARMEVWTQLQEAITASGPVPVGLFDSGTGLVHIAWIDRLILPHGGDDQDRRVAVPTNEQDLVPAYYRDSPFSRAWMRITRIQREVQFFDHYSFAEPPSLPNYDLATLKRFQGKVVREAGELRGMDTTIWVVRPRQTQDLSDKILLTTGALPEPISSVPVLCNSNLVLHLTDAHFAVGTHRGKHVWRLEGEAKDTRRTLVEAVMAALGDRKIGLILISGDFTFTGLPEEYTEALASIRLLLGVFNLSTDHLVVIPGNHDIQWSTDETYDPEAQVIHAPAEANRNYAHFYEQLYRHLPTAYLSMGRRFAFANGMSIEVAALNSSSLQTGRNFLAGVGKISEAALEDVANRMGWNNPAGSMALRLLMVHHHLALTEDLEPAAGYLRGFGLALDAPRIQRMAASYGVQLALHGHKHRAFLWRSFVFELPEHTKPNHYLGELAIIGGGSAGSIETEGRSNYFNLVEVRPEALALEIFQSRNEGVFTGIQRWQAPLFMEKEVGRLRLGVWERGPEQR